MNPCEDCEYSETCEDCNQVDFCFGCKYLSFCGICMCNIGKDCMKGCPIACNNGYEERTEYEDDDEDGDDYKEISL